MYCQDDDSDLPLFVALVSEQEGIVRLFFNNGVQLGELTKYDNTIFYVLVQYS